MTNGSIKLLKMILPGSGLYKSRKRNQSRYKHKIPPCLEMCSSVSWEVTGHADLSACLRQFMYQYLYLCFSVCASIYLSLGICLSACVLDTFLLMPGQYVTTKLSNHKITHFFRLLTYKIRFYLLLSFNFVAYIYKCTTNISVYLFSTYLLTVRISLYFYFQTNLNKFKKICNIQYHHNQTFHCLLRSLWLMERTLRHVSKSRFIFVSVTRFMPKIFHFLLLNRKMGSNCSWRLRNSGMWRPTGCYNFRDVSEEPFNSILILSSHLYWDLKATGPVTYLPAIFISFCKIA
jgi:hypothetical protein